MQIFYFISEFKDWENVSLYQTHFFRSMHFLMNYNKRIKSPPILRQKMLNFILCFSFLFQCCSPIIYVFWDHRLNTWKSFGEEWENWFDIVLLIFCEKKPQNHSRFNYLLWGRKQESGRNKNKQVEKKGEKSSFSSSCFWRLSLTLYYNLWKKWFLKKER